jgi:hypothetical protein
MDPVVTAPGILRSEPDISESLQPLRERLAEAVSWGSRHREGVPGVALRSAALAPPPAMPWPETVRSVMDRRLVQLGRSWRRTLDPLGGGLLLVYHPTPPHSRGAARQASEGYFDEQDAPPWDTWVAYVEEAARSYLVAWVPPFALGPVAAGMAAAPHTLCWLEGSGVGLGAKLKF